eukprot:Sdes_comp23579_c0_seq1m21782
MGSSKSILVHKSPMLEEERKSSKDLHHSMFFHFTGSRMRHTSWIREAFDYEDSYAPPLKLLGVYDSESIQETIIKYEIDKMLMAKGISKVEVQLDLTDNFVHKISIFASRSPPDLESKPFVINVVSLQDNWNPLNSSNPLIFQLFLKTVRSFDHLKQIQIHKVHGPEAQLLKNIFEWENITLVAIEWLLIQNPFETLKIGEVLLPGQSHPGMSMGPTLLKIFEDMSKQRGEDGFVSVPMFFHNALMFSRAFTFLNPAFQGKFSTLVADLSADIHSKGIAAVSNAILLGKLIHKPTNTRVLWSGEEQVYPASKRFCDYFESDQYKHICSLYSGSESSDSSSTESPHPAPLLRSRVSSFSLIDCISTSRGLFFIDWEGEMPSNDELLKAFRLRDVDTRIHS